MSGRRDMRRATQAGLAVAISVAWAAGPPRLSAEPINPVIVGDSAGFGAAAATIGSVSNGPGVNVTVDQHAERVFIDWQSFNIDASDNVNFLQGGSQWIAVNRVTGGLGPTTIAGMLTADGHVWIIDPAGIAFSSSAVVDVGGLLATASNIDPGDFLAVADMEDATGFTFSAGGNDTAQVSNAGTINSSGLLALIAPIVDNSGTLESAYGDVLLGGANAFRLSFTQVERPADADHPTAFDELLVTDFIIETPVTNDPVPGNDTVPVTNTGNLTGANVIVSAASAGGGAFINMDGVVEATSIGERSGDVVILGGGDFTGGAADAASGATDAIRIDNADISAAGGFVAQGTNVAIDKGTGPGTLTAGNIRISATNGDATSDVALSSSTGGIDMSATGLASVAALDAATTVDINAADIDLNGTVAGGGAIAMEATAGDISGTDIDIEGASVELTGAIAATDSASVVATTGDATLNDDLTSTGSILVEAASGKATVAGLDADTTIDVTAEEIDLNGVVVGGGAVTLEATAGDISGTDIDIEGTSVELTGAVTATDSASIVATTDDATLNGDLTSTGSIFLEAASGKVTAAGLDADTTIDVTAEDIDLNGIVLGGGAVTLEATAGDISGTDIDIQGASVELTGPVAAADSASIVATTGDATLHNDLTSTGSILIEATEGKVTTAGLDADTTIDVTADDIEVRGDTAAGGALSMIAQLLGIDLQGTVEAASVSLTAEGDVTATGTITSTSGSIGIEAGDEASLAALDAATTLDILAADIDLNGVVTGGGAVIMEATAGNISGTDIDIEGASVELTGPVAATDSAAIVATTGDITINDDLTSTGSILIEGTEGKATTAGLDADTTLGITADDIEVTGDLQAGGALSLIAELFDIVLQGTTEGASVSLDAERDVTTAETTTSTSGGIDIDAGNEANLAALDAATAVDVNAADIDLNGAVAGGGAVTLEASAGDISGTDIDIEGASVELTGPVNAKNSASIVAATGGATLNDDLTSTGSILIEATEGKVTTAGLDADTTLDITADDIEVTGDATAGGALSMIAELVGIDLQGTVEAASVNLEAEQNIAATGSITSTSGAVEIDAGGDADLAALDAATTLEVTAEDIDLNGPVAAGGAITMTASAGDISGTDIDIEGASIDLTGPVNANDSASLSAATGDITLADDMTSTGSILIEAPEGKVTTAGLDADTTLDVTADDIEVKGDMGAGGALTMTAELLNIDLQGTVEAASVDLEAAGDITASDTITATTGSIEIDADGEASLAALDAETTIEVTAASLDVSGDATAGGDATFRALAGDATLGGKTTSENGDILVEAKLGLATVGDMESDGDTTIVAGAIDVLGDIVTMGQASLQALTGDVDVQGSVTANGGLLLLEAGQGDAIINRISSLTNVSIMALDLDLSGSISAGDEVRLTSLDSGTTVVLGGDGGTGTVILRNPAGLTIDADELSRISTGTLRIDAEANDALLLDVDFTGATLGDLSIGASNSSQIIAAGSVQGLDALTLGYVDGADDRRPGLIVVPGELGRDTATGRLGAVTLNSSQDIIIGPQAFRAFYEANDPSLSTLGKLNPATYKSRRNHIFIAADDLKLHAPGDIVQLNTGTGVDGRGIVFKVAAVGEGVVNPSGNGPEKVVLFGVIIRDDGTRVTSYSAGLEPRILFPGTTDGSGNVVEEPLGQSKEYRFNLCIIGDAVSCSNALLREAEPTAGVAGSDPNPYVAGPDLSFDDEEDDLDGEGDLGGIAATGNESLWGAGVR